jgi:AbrB family looped-hinge helix DNA binding protein
MATTVPRGTICVVDKRGKVGLPAAIRERASLAAGDRVAVSVRRDGALLLAKVADPLEELIGSGHGLSRATNAATLRNEWER